MWKGSVSGPAKWPLLRPEDGGRVVHQLQNLLAKAGYYVDEDDDEILQAKANLETLKNLAFSELST